MDYLIIGNGVASIGAIEGIRRYDAEGRITVISQEPDSTYGRPLISYFLAGKLSLERLALRPPAFYEKNNVRQVLGVRVRKLDTANRKVMLDTGEELAYDKLLLATGGVSRRLELPGLEGPDVYPFTTLAHAERLAGLAGKGKKAVIVGAGLIALKAAEGLVARGEDVTMVVRSRIMRTYFDEKAGELLVQHLQSKGLNFMQGATPTSIKRDQRGNVQAVETDKGEAPADLVIMAAGVTPRMELAQGAGLRTNRGVVADSFLRTSDENIYAAGDVAETMDMLSGEYDVTPIWPNAHQQGLTAGKNMAGAGVEYPGSLSMNSVAYFGLPTASVGIVNQPEDGSYDIFAEIDQASSIYRKLVFRGDRLVGYVLVGNIDHAGLYSGFVRFQVPVDDDARARLKDGRPSSLLWPDEFFDTRWNPELEDVAG